MPSPCTVLPEPSLELGPRALAYIWRNISEHNIIIIHGMEKTLSLIMNMRPVLATSLPHWARRHGRRPRTLHQDLHNGKLNLQLGSRLAQSWYYWGQWVSSWRCHIPNTVFYPYRIPCKAKRTNRVSKSSATVIRP